MEEVLSQARTVLEDHKIRPTCTVPSHELYPHQWLWDSCFVAIGLRHVDTERAKNEIRGVLEGQWRDGMLPHVQFSDMDIDYFPDQYK